MARKQTPPEITPEERAAMEAEARPAGWDVSGLSEEEVSTLMEISAWEIAPWFGLRRFWRDQHVSDGNLALVAESEVADAADRDQMDRYYGVAS